MSGYLEVAEGMAAPGLRLVLTAGVPGPWSESAKGILHVKGIPYQRVIQRGGLENAELKNWLGRDNAPIAVYEDGPPLDGWVDILYLAERLSPEPSLIPSDIDERITMFGLAREVCGPDGFGWQRRLELTSVGLSMADKLPEEMLDVYRRLASKYGFSEAAAKAAPQRAGEILMRLEEQLRLQRDRGSSYFIGDTLSALDIYWAAFAALLDPLPHDQCPMPKGLRRLYSMAGADRYEILLAHRDAIYEKHLTLPLDF